MEKCIYCDQEVEKIGTIDSGIADFLLDIDDENKDAGFKFSISFMGKKKVSHGVKAFQGEKDNSYICKQCSKAFIIYNLETNS